MTYSQKSLKEGFTLVEIMIAISIIAILAAVIIPNFLSYLNKSRVSATKTNLNMVKSAIDLYNANLGKYPERLRDLYTEPSDPKLKRDWMPFLSKKEEPKDGWKKKIEYKLNNGVGEHPYDLYSYGSSKGKGTPKAEWISVWDL